jgi:hypothetical protein
MYCLPQVAIVKKGLEQQPIFHKATWVHSTFVIAPFQKSVYGKFSGIGWFAVALCRGLFKSKR